MPYESEQNTTVTQVKVLSLLMTPSNKKVDYDDHFNQISDLPSEVIGDILAHLPVADAVRTSILSRRWRYMWVSVPQLDFGDQFFQIHKHLGGLKISSIITEVLLLHDGPVYKFTLHIRYDEMIRNECLNKWIFILSRSGIKVLELVNQHSDLLPIPSHVFSCQRLTHLKLDRFKPSVSPNFCGFKSLLVLKLYNMRFESVALKSLVSGCPLLEELTISSCYIFECIDVSAPTLKVLCIENSGFMKSICLDKARNLIDLTLTGNVNHVRGRVCDLVKGMPKIERLVMGSGYIKMLSANFFQPMPQRSFGSLKYLQLSGVNLEESGQFWFVLNLLISATNLVELLIKGFGGSLWNLTWMDHDSCCLSWLKMVNIEFGITGNKTFRLEMHAISLIIRFILAKSPSLETLTFRVIILGQHQTNAATLLSISRDLLQMERASPRAQIKFLHKECDSV